MKKTELYFGMEVHGRDDVTEDEFNEFLERHVSPAFPDGLTVTDAQGQWLSPVAGLVKEGSKILILLHDGADNAIESIRNIYKALFAQDSVLRIDHAVNVSF